MMVVINGYRRSVVYIEGISALRYLYHPLHIQASQYTKHLQTISTVNHASTMSTPVVLILGSGPRVGLSVATKFAHAGYKVAIASRNGTGNANAQGFLSLKADFTQPESVPALFAAVMSQFHSAPSVVVYNAAAFTNPPDQASALSVPVEAVVADLNVNTVSAYVAAQQAVAGWATLPEGVKKTFIYTGNILNGFVVPMPMILTLGIGKSASAFWVGMADGTYADKGFR